MSAMFPKTDEEKSRWLVDRLQNATILLAQANEPAAQAKWEAWVLEWARRLKAFHETGEFDTTSTLKKRKTSPELTRR